MEEPPKSAMGEQQHEEEFSATTTPTTTPKTRRHKIKSGRSCNALSNNTAQFQKSTTASIHALKVKIGQLAAALANRPQGSLPSNAEKNSKE